MDPRSASVRGEKRSVIIDAVRIRDERYLFSLTPWVYFPLWFGLGTSLGLILEGAPLWMRVLIIGPIAWTMPFYVARLPVFAQSAVRRRHEDGDSTNS